MPRPVPLRLTGHILEKDRRGVVVLQRDRVRLPVEGDVRRERHLAFTVTAAVQAQLDNRKVICRQTAGATDGLPWLWPR